MAVDNVSRQAPDSAHDGALDSGEVVVWQGRMSPLRMTWVPYAAFLGIVHAAGIGSASLRLLAIGSMVAGAAVLVTAGWR